MRADLIQLTEAPSYNKGMYQAINQSRSITIPVRGLNYHVRTWGDEHHPKLFFLHGWMDVSASFQFLVDQLKGDWHIIAPDWRGYGESDSAAGSALNPASSPDTYWFPDYMADLDALLDHFSPLEPVNLVAHSMGGNIACLYAGVRPHRVAGLVNLEGYGMPDTQPDQAPRRYAKWMDEIKVGVSLRPYASIDKVIERLIKNNPRLPEDKARWLAGYWSKPVADGYALRADPAHKVSYPILYRVEEVLACWRLITAPVLLIESDAVDSFHQFTRNPAYRVRFEAFANFQAVTVPNAGHMLHHDQPKVVADLVESFVKRLDAQNLTAQSNVTTREAE